MHQPTRKLEPAPNTARMIVGDPYGKKLFVEFFHYQPSRSFKGGRPRRAWSAKFPMLFRETLIHLVMCNIPSWKYDCCIYWRHFKSCKQNSVDWSFSKTAGSGEFHHWLFDDRNEISLYLPWTAVSAVMGNLDYLCYHWDHHHYRRHHPHLQ